MARYELLECGQNHKEDVLRFFENRKVVSFRIEKGTFLASVRGEVRLREKDGQFVESRDLTLRPILHHCEFDLIYPVGFLVSEAIELMSKINNRRKQDQRKQDQRNHV